MVNLKCNSIEHNDNCAKASGTLWQFYRDIPAVSGNSQLLILMWVILVLNRLMLK